jgi:hypothetical protein
MPRGGSWKQGWVRRSALGSFGAERAGRETPAAGVPAAGSPRSLRRLVGHEFGDTSNGPAMLELVEYIDEIDEERRRGCEDTRETADEKQRDAKRRGGLCASVNRPARSP